MLIPSTLPTPNPSHHGPTPAERLAEWYEALSPGSLVQVAQYYAPKARFKDPFNDVQGHAAIQRIFSHMFMSLDQPRFVVTSRLEQGSQAFLVWEFYFRMKRWSTDVEHCIRGATHVQFDAEGQVIDHRDYWDAAEELYEKLPVLGSLMRWLRKQAAR